MPYTAGPCFQDQPLPQTLRDSSLRADRVCAVLAAQQALANACMAHDPAKRPTFAAALAAIDAKLSELQAATETLDPSDPVPRGAAPPPQAASPFATARAPPLELRK